MTTSGETDNERAEFETLAALAHRQHRAGRLDEAAATYGKMIAMRPDIAAAHNVLGTVLAQQGKLDLAGARFQQALALSPGYAEAHVNLGNVLLNQGKLDEAAARYRQALVLRPDFAEAHYNLGNALKRLGKLDQAIDCYRQALVHRPDHADAHNNFGNVLLSQDKLDEAATHYEQALSLQPNYAQAHINLGNVLLQQRKLDEAAARYRLALALRPDIAETHYNLGNVLKRQGKLDEAAAFYGHALALNPDFADAHYNLGSTLREQRKLDEAAARFEHALTLRPDYADAQWGLATCYLVRGDYQRGWHTYEGRLRIPGFVAQHGLPPWKGEPLAGRSLLLLAEQGLGDTLHFIRYARLLKERGARVVLAVQATLGRLLASHPDVDDLFIFDSAEELPRTDFALHLLSAPGLFRTDASTIPCKVPYLWADPELTDRWRRELTKTDGFKIGIAWQGARDYSADCLRSVPLAQFAPLASLPGVRLVSLQKGFGSEQVATVDFPVLDLSDRLDEAAGPFMDTAAVIQNLDLVVTVDTAIAHLAGAMGVPVWVALQYSPYWFWLLDREDSPWYPTARLFRQTTFGDWPDVFERMAQALPARRAETA